MRPGAMEYSRRIRLPSTTPQPSAFRAGSMCSARVSDSFIGFAFKEETLENQGCVNFCCRFLVLPLRKSQVQNGT